MIPPLHPDILNLLPFQNHISSFLLLPYCHLGRADLISKSRSSPPRILGIFQKKKTTLMEDNFNGKTTLKENNPNGRSKEDSQQGG